MEKMGCVFDIQRFSVHDGPGIRTLVFLKGCPLRCDWCANPESQSFSPELFFAPDKCVGCRKCLNVCPQGAISAASDNRRQLVFQRGQCLNCGRCAESCYAEARILKGRLMRVTEVMEEILKDGAFFARSGGGVTLGGGEPLAQPEFAAALLQACGEHGLHRAVETAGNIPWEVLAEVAPHTDMFLFDVKHTDPARLERFTGADAALIQSNLVSLSRQAKHLIVRTPIVPGFNDSEVDVRSIARGLRQLGISELHLLPYHRHGQGKYKLLGRDCHFAGPLELAPDVLDYLQRVAADEGLGVRVVG